MAPFEVKLNNYNMVRNRTNPTTFFQVEFGVDRAGIDHKFDSWKDRLSYSQPKVFWKYSCGMRGRVRDRD